MTVSWVILGSSPPPIGGVTTFVERFADRLSRRGSKVAIVNPRNPSELLQLLAAALGRPNFVLLNTMNLVGLLVSRCLFPCSTLILVDHNHSRKIVALGSVAGLNAQLKRLLYRVLLSTLDAIWIVSPHLELFHRQLGHGTRLGHINPYVRPDLRHYENIVATYSDCLRSALKRDHADEVLFVTSAYKLIQERGRDLYGFDLALEGLQGLIASGRSARLIAFVADTSDPSALRQYQAKAVSMGLGDFVIWESGQKIMWPVFLHADCYLRLTSTDGWSISVEEALDLGCPVIASDVTPRDPRCAEFVYPNPVSLIEQMLSAVSRETRAIQGHFPGPAKFPI